MHGDSISHSTNQPIVLVMAIYSSSFGIVNVFFVCLYIFNVFHVSCVYYISISCFLIVELYFITQITESVYPFLLLIDIWVVSRFYYR